MKNTCGHTENAGVGAAIDQLSVWSRTARRQSEATSRAAAAAEAICMIWAKLDDATKATIEADTLLRERIRFVTGYYGYNCS